MPTVKAWLPRWAPMAGICLFGLILVKKGVPQGLINHEIKHYEQQKADGMLRWYWRYVFWPKKWRVVYEAEAYALQVRTGEEKIEWCAKALSGWLYLWPCSYDYALEAIRSRV